MLSIFPIPSEAKHIDDQKVIDKLEKVSKRKMVSQSQVIRDFILEGLKEWDC